MTAGELFASKSSAPSGSTALYNLQTLCQEGGCGEFGLIPITDITCDLINPELSASLSTTTHEADLEIVQLNAILTTTIYGADLITPTLDGDLICQQQ